MKQEQKDLLLKDLCARLPYGVKVEIPDLFFSTKTNVEVLNEIFRGDDGEFRCNDSGVFIKHIKPYLFPLSSMSEEQIKEYLPTKHKITKSSGKFMYLDSPNTVNYYHKNHFDYRGLINKGLAIDATGKNIY